MLASGGPKKQVRFSTTCAADTGHELPAEEYSGHLEELDKEWRKTKHNPDHINVLLRDTFTTRRKWISQLPAGEFRRIVDKFPCFEDGQFVSISSCQNIYTMSNFLTI